MNKNQCDFSGWATRNDLLCSDGRTIRKNAFQDCDGLIVPLVWNHQHNGVNDVLGHALLENREEGVYTYGFFNDTPEGRKGKECVKHGDINQLSIYANKLKQRGGDVLHGMIREVSLVLAGANPGAFIDVVMSHSENDGAEEEGFIYTGEFIELAHSDESEENTMNNDTQELELNHADESSETVADVFNSLSDKQKNVVYAIIGHIVNQNNEEETAMHSNIFEGKTHNDEENALIHSEMAAAIADAKRYGSMKESVLNHNLPPIEYLAHGDATYGVKDVDWLFPEAHNLNTTPEFIYNQTGWVKKVMAGVHHVPFSRIKSMFADINEDEARAKGYIKGKLKKEEVFSLLKRTTTPTTVYKKQKMDRDDMIDITDFDVIAWLKGEMRMKLDEELARAYLIGDGRLASDDDKINENNIRPIWKDDDLFTIKAQYDVAASMTEDQEARTFIKTCIKARKSYKGTGEPTLYATQDIITKCLLIEDTNQRVIYESKAALATRLGVKEIVTVELMENQTRTVDNKVHTLQGIIVNLADYDVGADKGGAVNMFDDFDIDYNQQKYLIETRCSGALVKPFSAIAVESVPAV